MIQTIYSSVTNADIVSKRKDTKVSSEPIPLLRDKYLGEYRTELERAKVRKNLGIPDENSLQWGNIDGFIEQQQDLVTYVESKWKYSTSLDESIENVHQALDVVIDFVTSFKGEQESITFIQNTITGIQEDLETLQGLISGNSDNIQLINESITSINKAIVKLNEDLVQINVDENIANWINSKLQQSKTISESFDVIISEQPNNAIQVLDYREGVEEDLENNIEKVEEILPGLYVKDLSSDIKQIEDKQLELDNSVTGLSESLENVSKYTTLVSDDTKVPTTVGGITEGTTAAQLKDKTISQLIDILLFPTVWIYPVSPIIYYNYTDNLVEVGSSIQEPELVFVQNDAGTLIEQISKLKYNGEQFTGTTYSELGDYIYEGTASYEDGKCATNNKGETNCEIQITAGTVETTYTITATYPWYAGDSDLVSKQPLIAFNQLSSEISLNLGGKSVIKLPGENSTIESFTVNLGMGYQPVDLNGWSKTTESNNGINYSVWTKEDSYSESFPHLLTFKLSL